VAKVFKVTGDRVRSVAQTVAGISMGAIMCLFGILSIGSMPVLAAVFVIAGLAMIALNVWPLFGSGEMTTANGKG